MATDDLSFICFYFGSLICTLGIWKQRKELEIYLLKIQKARCILGLQVHLVPVILSVHIRRGNRC